MIALTEIVVVVFYKSFQTSARTVSEIMTWHLPFTSLHSLSSHHHIILHYIIWANSWCHLTRQHPTHYLPQTSTVHLHRRPHWSWSNRFISCPEGLHTCIFACYSSHYMYIVSIK